LGTGDQFKVIAGGVPRTGPVHALDADIARLGAALAAGEPVDDDLAHTLFGQIVWPVTLGRPPGDLAAAFAIRCEHDNWSRSPQDGQEAWTPFPRTECPVQLAEGLGDETSHWVNFAAAQVPDELDSLGAAYPVRTHLEIAIVDEGAWRLPGGPPALAPAPVPALAPALAPAGARRVTPSPFSLLKRPGVMFVEFTVVAGGGPPERRGTGPG